LAFWVIVLVIRVRAAHDGLGTGGGLLMFVKTVTVYSCNGWGFAVKALIIIFIVSKKLLGEETRRRSG
jgi:hypothetical protein